MPQPDSRVPSSADVVHATPGVAWYATLILAFMYWLSVLDRFIISLLVDPIKRDLGLTDLQFGVLHGLAFAVTFSIFGLVCGALADRFNRRWIVFIGVAIWSVSTALCGAAKSYVHLLLARVGVGAGEAALNPCATSMITDMFPKHRLSLAMAVYAMGSSIGAGTAFLIGGLIVEMVSHHDTYVLPIIGEVRSWQAVFYLVGIPGTVLSLVIFTVPEPVRRGFTAAKSDADSLLSSYRELLTFVRTRLRFFVCHYIGFAFASAVVAGGGGWYAVHIIRAFGWSPAQTGLYLGGVMIAAAVCGKAFSGFMMDTLFRRGYKDAQLRWYAGAMLVTVPIGWYAFTRGDPMMFFIGLFFYLVLVQPLPVSAYASLNLVTPSHLRGAGVALFAAVGLIGAAAGPLMIPAAAQWYANPQTAIGHGFATVIVGCCPCAALFISLAMREMRAAVEASEARTV